MGNLTFSAAGRPMRHALTAVLLLVCLFFYLYVRWVSGTYSRLLDGSAATEEHERRDVLFSFIGAKNGLFRPTIEHLNSFVRSFRRYNQKARIVVFFTDDHRTGLMEVRPCAIDTIYM